MRVLTAATPNHPDPEKVPCLVPKQQKQPPVNLPAVLDWDRNVDTPRHHHAVKPLAHTLA